MRFRIRDAQSDALRCSQVARDLSAALEQKGYSPRYDASSRLLEARDALGHVSRYQLARNGKVEAYVTAAGRWSRFQLDDEGRLTDLLEPSGRRTEVSYDTAGAPARFVRDGAVLAQFAWNRARTNGEALFWDGTRAQATYSEDGKLLRFSNRLQQTTAFTYDDTGRLAALADGLGQETHFGYDERGRPRRTAYADGRVESLTQDAPGGIRVALGAKELLRKQLDDSGRPLEVSYADGAEYEFAYDDAGHLVSAKGPNGLSTYAYRDDGKLISETNGDQSFEFEYDALGLLKSLRYPDGSRAEFSYDPDRRLARATWGDASIALSYDTQDQRRTQTTPRLHTCVNLEPSGRVARSVVSNRATREPLFETQYAYDAQSRLVTKTDSELGQRRFTYDAESQLLAVKDAHGRWQETFAYDAAGNRRSVNGQSVTIGAGNRVEAQGDWRCRYDERGNVIELAAGPLSYRFSYDLKNQLVEASGPSGVVTFEYDALGRRIQKRSDARTVRYVWCGELLTREIIIDAKGESIRDYLYRPGSYEPLALRVDGRYYYYHNDHLGTPERLSDEHGEIAWAAEYSAFGFAHVSVERVENPLRFLGQYADSETNLHYNRFRYYSPALGRYLSTDPLSLFGGHNLYLFANNDPTNASDPLGLFSWGAIAAAAGAAVAAAAVVVLAPAAVPLMLAVVGGIALGTALGIGIAEATSIDHFCLPCFMKGVEGAFPVAFGLGFGIAVIGAVCAPLGVVLAVGAAAYGTYAVLDQHFGWSSGKPFDQMTDNEKSEALGGLVGGTAGGLLGGLAGGAFGRGLAEGLAEPQEGAVKGGKTPEEKLGGEEETKDQPELPKGGKPIETGLGPDVDARVNKSPTLQQDWADLTSNPDPLQNWTMEQGPPGAGSRCYPGRKVIQLDPTLANDPDVGAATVAHEIGHAKSPGARPPNPMTATDRTTYVEQATEESLTEEGRATLKNAQARQEILDGGGPDIGYPGNPQNTPAYDNVAQRVNAGESTPEQGAQEIGQIYGNGETVSGTNKTYGDYMRDYYGGQYDGYHP